MEDCHDLSKSKMQRLLWKKHKGNMGIFRMTPCNPGGGDVVGAKRARPRKNRSPPALHMLMILPNDDIISTDVSQKLIANKIDPMKVKLAL